jgi:basic membrane protein A
VWGIGVDADQSFLGPHILTSAVKRVDTAVFLAIKRVVDGNFKGGNITGDVALAPYHDLDSKVPADVKTKITQVTSDVTAGKVQTGWDKPTGNCPTG